MTDRDYLSMAYDLATHSPDPSTQNGALLVRDDVILLGTCNRFPEGIEDTEARWSVRERKYVYVNHAERRAVAIAARDGIRLGDSTMYVPWFACNICAQQIVDAGIKCCVGHAAYVDAAPQRWRESVAEGIAILNEAKVECRWFTGAICSNHKLLFDGNIWTP